MRRSKTKIVKFSFIITLLIVLLFIFFYRFNQEKVLLVGHSFGTYIGMKAVAEAPEKYYAYIGIRQVADSVQSE